MHAGSTRGKIYLLENGVKSEALHSLASQLAQSYGRTVETFSPGCIGNAIIGTRAAPRLVLAPWDDSSDFTGLLNRVLELDAATVFLRSGGIGELQSCERLLVPTAGGPHTLQQLRVARDIGSVLRLPMELLRITPADYISDQISDEMAARMVGIRAGLTVHHAPDALAGILSVVHQKDLIMLGAPHYWRLHSHFRGSIPDLVSRRTTNPLAMLVARKPAQLSLVDVLWGEHVLLDVRARDRGEVVGLLLDALVEGHQLPGDMRDEALARALEREQALPTSIGCQTAFPHVALDDFLGVIGALAVCPAGVKFNGGEDPVHFVMLFVSGCHQYEDYLHVMAQFARQFIRPEVRRQLLQAKTAAEALNIICATDSSDAQPTQAL